MCEHEELERKINKQGIVIGDQRERERAKDARVWTEIAT
jgi:hypothetical protein